MKLVLTSPAELSAAVAECVTHLPLRDDARITKPEGAKVVCFSREYGVCDEIPKLAESADTVLPLMPSGPHVEFWTADCGYMGYRICIRDGDGNIKGEGHGKSFATACCLAILRSRGFAVEYTEGGA